MRLVLVDTTPQLPSANLQVNSVKDNSCIVSSMPRKIRQLISDLRKAGFINVRGKGSHRIYEHPKGPMVVISGNLGDDAKFYQEKQVKSKIEESQK